MWSELGGVILGAGALLGASFLAPESGSQVTGGVDSDSAALQVEYNQQEARSRDKRDVLCLAPRFITSDCLSPTSQGFWALLQRTVKHQVAPMFSSFGSIEVLLVEHMHFAVLDLSALLSKTRTLKALRDSLLAVGLLMSPGEKAGHFHIFFQSVDRESEVVESIAKKLTTALNYLIKSTSSSSLSSSSSSSSSSLSSSSSTSVPTSSSSSSKRVVEDGGGSTSKKRRDA